MRAKERRKLKHTLKTNIDSADIWLKLGLDITNNAGLATEDFKTSDSSHIVVAELEKAKKDISENYNKFMSEIDNCIASLKQ